MGGYFETRFRKIGLLTLLAACVLAAAWLRSSTGHDAFTIVKGSVRLIKLASESNRLGLAIIHIDSDEQVPVEMWTSDAAHVDHWGLRLVPFAPRISYQIDGRIVIFGNGQVGYRNTTIVADWVHIPYWSLVIPLTLFSAWSLLSKSRSTHRPELRTDIF